MATPRKASAAPRRRKVKDHAQEVYDEHLGDEDDAEEEVESEETEGEQLSTGRNSGKGHRSQAGGEGEDSESDQDDQEEVRDPIAKAIADTEARMRTQYIKPLKAELAKLRKDVGNTGAVVGTVRSLRLENEFLRLAGGTFHDAATAFKLADTSKVQLADDGTITGMQEAVDALAEDHPYLVRDELGLEDEDDDLDDEVPDLPSGRPMNSQKMGRRVGGPQASDASLYKRYPALQRRRGW